MNDFEFTISKLKQIHEEAAGGGLTFSDRAGLFAALRVLEEEVKSYINDCDKLDRGYAREKLYKFRWSVSAILGFDIDNGHPAHQHSAWAHGAMNTLEDVLSDAVYNP